MDSKRLESCTITGPIKSAPGERKSLSEMKSDESGIAAAAGAEVEGTAARRQVGLPELRNLRQFDASV